MPSSRASAAARTRSACSGRSSTRPSRSTASRRRAKASKADAHAATLTAGRVGVLHGSRTMVLADDDGQNPRSALGERRTRLSRRRTRTFVTHEERPRDVPVRDRRRSPRRHEARRPHRGHSRSRSKRRTPSRVSATSRGVKPTRSAGPCGSRSVLPAVATRILATLSAVGLGEG